MVWNYYRTHVDKEDDAQRSAGTERSWSGGRKAYGTWRNGVVPIYCKSTYIGHIRCMISAFLKYSCVKFSNCFF